MKNKIYTLLALALCFFSKAEAQLWEPTAVCLGSTYTYADSIPGGSWSLSSSTLATISSSGVLTPLLAGTETVTYTLGSWVNTKVVNIYPVPGPISGPTTLCPGTTITLTDPSTGGVWGGGSWGVASIGSTGVVTGIHPGTITLSYTIGGVCSATYPIIVGGISFSEIGGDTSLCVGGSAPMSISGSAGTWSSANPAIASIDPATGITTGVSPGTTTLHHRAHIYLCGRRRQPK